MTYYDIFGIPKIIYYSASVAIVLQSLIARSVFINIIHWIPFKYESSRLNYTIVSVFMIFFFNYGVIYMYAPMRIPTPIVHSIFNGVYKDFNDSWFEDVGSLIIQVAFINAIMPPIELTA